MPSGHFPADPHHKVRAVLRLKEIVCFALEAPADPVLSREVVVHVGGHAHDVGRDGVEGDEDLPSGTQMCG